MLNIFLYESEIVLKRDLFIDKPQISPVFTKLKAELLRLIYSPQVWDVYSLNDIRFSI